MMGTYGQMIGTYGQMIGTNGQTTGTYDQTIGTHAQTANAGTLVSKDTRHGVTKHLQIKCAGANR